LFLRNKRKKARTDDVPRGELQGKKKRGKAVLQSNFSGKEERRGIEGHGRQIVAKD